MLIIGYNYGENLALQVFHTTGSWVLTFIGSLFLIGISVLVFKAKIFDNGLDQCSECVSEKKAKRVSCITCGRLLQLKRRKINKADLIKIGTVITLVVLFLSIQAPVFAITKTPANIVVDTPSGQTASTAIFPNPPNYILKFDGRDTDFEEASQQDMSLSYVYYPEKAILDPIWVNLEIASARSSLHRWEVCLYDNALRLGQTPRANLLELTDIQIGKNRNQ